MKDQQTKYQLSNVESLPMQDENTQINLQAKEREHSENNIVIIGIVMAMVIFEVLPIPVSIFFGLFWLADQSIRSNKRITAEYGQLKITIEPPDLKD